MGWWWWPTGVWVHLELNWQIRPSPPLLLLPLARKHHLVWLQQVGQAISISNKTKANKIKQHWKGLVEGWKGQCMVVHRDCQTGSEPAIWKLMANSKQDQDGC